MAVATPSRPKAGGGRFYVIIGTALGIFSILAFVLLGGVLLHGGGGSSQRVVVAAKPISLRSVITSDDLTLANVSPAPTGAFTDVKQVSGQAAELNILPGQPILSNMVSKSPDQIQGPAPAYLPIPKGFVAVTIPTSEQQGVGGYPQAGDYLTVDVTLKWQAQWSSRYQGSGADTITKTVFTNLRILRVGPANVTSNGQASSQGTQTQGVASSLTVLMTECDAEFMNWFLAAGQVHYQLESYKDYSSPPTKPDPSCPSVTGTKGVNVADIDNRYHFSQQ